MEAYSFGAFINRSALSGQQIFLVLLQHLGGIIAQMFHLLVLYWTDIHSHQCA
jgi:hypothetical protein